MKSKTKKQKKIFSLRVVTRKIPVKYFGENFLL
jgi:hypothetical protein